MYAFDTRRSRMAATLVSGGPEDAAEALQGHFGAINPYAPFGMVKPLGVAVVSDQMLSRDRLLRTEFYNDFMLRNETTSTVGIAIDRSASSAVLLSTATRLDDAGEQRRLADQYTRLAPHLQRAARFYRRNSHMSLVTELGGSLFDAVDTGVILITPDQRVRGMSATGERLIGGQITFDISGRLRLPLPPAQAALVAMCQPGYDGPQSVDFITGGLQLSLVRISRGGVLGIFDDCGVALLVRDRGGVASARDREALRRAYGLTPAEARAMDGILNGWSVDEIAAAADRSRETIRSQLRSLYEKTGSGGRADLIRLMAGLRS